LEEYKRIDQNPNGIYKQNIIINLMKEKNTCYNPTLWLLFSPQAQQKL
jgi:plasmid rolling circle replication initiator protein Rep